MEARPENQLSQLSLNALMPCHLLLIADYVNLELNVRNIVYVVDTFVISNPIDGSAMSWKTEAAEMRQETKGSPANRSLTACNAIATSNEFHNSNDCYMISPTRGRWS